MLEGSTTNAKRMITESVEQCITAIKNREKNLMAALDRDKRLSQEILNRQRERLISKRTALEKVLKGADGDGRGYTCFAKETVITKICYAFPYFVKMWNGNIL